MTFDAGSIYRRKSSLVSSETPAPKLRKGQSSPDKTQCIVHQLLESQKRARHAESARQRHHDHPNHTSHDHDSKDASATQGLDRLVEPKGGGGKSRLAILSGGASDAEGQADEHEWKKQIGKTTSEMDLQQVEHELHSRLLTKKQLSEMAWGVRELSRRLGSMRLKFRVRNIFILTKIYDSELIPKTRELVRWLLDKERDVRYTVYLGKDLKGNKEFDTAGLIEELRKDYVESGELEEEKSHDISKRLRWWDEHMCRTRPHTFDFVITLGGDGTVLYASWLFQRIVPPVLSFALGSLGFLTKFDFDDYQSCLNTAFKDGVTVSLRLRFEGTIMRSQKKKVPKSELLNDGKSSGSGSASEEDEKRMQRERDLVEELVGEEQENEHTHKPDGTYEILNEIVVDRGPNPSKLSSFYSLTWSAVAKKSE